MIKSKQYRNIDDIRNELNDLEYSLSIIDSNSLYLTKDEELELMNNNRKMSESLIIILRRRKILKIKELC
jgi:hypothetical protein